MKEIVFATVLNDGYVPALRAFINSVKHHNPNFNYRFVVFHCGFLPQWGELSYDNIELLDSLYDNFDFIEPSHKNYISNNRKDIKYLSIESFNLDAEKVIFVDADIICLGDLKELTEFETDGIAMVHCKHNCEYYVGVMVIGKKYLNNETYLDILKFDDSKSKKFGVDMKLLNTYFEGKIEPLPDQFDAVVTEVQKRDDKYVISCFYSVWQDMIKRGETDLQLINKEWKTKYSKERMEYRYSIKNLEEVKLLHYIYSPWIEVGREDLINNINNGEDMLALWNYYLKMF